MHTFFCKFYTLICKIYTFFCKIYTFFCKIYILICKIFTFSVKLTLFSVKFTLFLYSDGLVIRQEALMVIYHADILVDVVVRLGSHIDNTLIKHTYKCSHIGLQLLFYIWSHILYSAKSVCFLRALHITCIRYTCICDNIDHHQNSIFCKFF